MEFRIDKNVKYMPHNRHWQFCVGSGHAKLALRTDYTKQLKFIHDELGIERVRFHGIFDDDMNTDAKGIFYYEPNITPPADNGKWTEYIQAFIRFLQHRYGEEEIRSWFFEVWNEPDLQIAFFSGNRDEYFKLYEVTARAIKAVDPQLKIGGPATSSSKWVQSFVRYCRSNEVPVDFITTHQYAGDPLGGVEDQGEAEDAGAEEENIPEKKNGTVDEVNIHIMKQLSETEEKTFLAGFRAVMPDKSEQMDIPNDLFVVNSAKVRQQADGLPVYYTEWNENAIFSAYTNDTRKVAAYQVKAILDTMDIIEGSSIWCFSDIFEELHPFAEEFHGGFGLLTLDGIPKPAFYGLKMLVMAGDERMDLGEDSTRGEIGIAGFRKNGEQQILLFRQKMRNLELPKEHVKIEIELEEKPTKVLLNRIDEEHCNPLRLWEEDGRKIDLNHSEIAQLKEKSSMKEEEWEYQYTDGILTIEADVGVNDLYFFQICGAEL